MDALNSLMDGFAIALEPQNLLYALIGVFIGTLVGVLPGLGPVATIALLLPFAVGLGPASAMILLGGIYYGAMYGGTISAVLLNIPGESSAVMTALDGYQMHLKGRGGAALSISAIASFVAGTVSIVLLIVLAPFLSDFGLKFGPPEYFALVFLGLALVSGIVGGSDPLKGFLMMVVGLAIATVGADPVSATSRFTFGNLELEDGIGFLPVAVGLFGLAEVFENYEKARRLRKAQRQDVQFKLRDLVLTRDELRRSFWPIWRGTGTGFMVGVLPGSGATVGSFMAYGIEQKLSKTPRRFGKGAIEGVTGAEAANNSATGGSMLPMLTLGLPGSPATAILLFALILIGLTPGPQLFESSPDVVWPFLASMYIGNLMLLILNTLFIPVFIWLVRVGAPIMNPLVILLCIVGVYSANYSIVDIWVMIAFGVIGFVMRKRGFSPAPLILAVVLGPIAERALRQSLIISDGSPSILVMNSPITMVLMGLAALLFLAKAVVRKPKILDQVAEEVGREN